MSGDAAIRSLKLKLFIYNIFDKIYSEIAKEFCE